MSEDEARQKEREANEIPKGPRWLWDWRVYFVGAVFGVLVYLVRNDWQLPF